MASSSGSCGGLCWNGFFFFFFAGGLKRKPQGLQERFAGMGFSSGCGRLYEVTGQAFRLPTVVPLKGEKPKLTRAGVIPCKGQWDKSTLPVSMLEQNIRCKGILKTTPVLPRPKGAETASDAGLKCPGLLE